MDYAGIANWKCKCGRHGSMEHPVNGYCEARIAIEKLESELAAVRAKADRYEKALKAIAEQEAYWRAGHNLAKQALSGEAGE